jgi:hypothetical protein|tara:strand:- start:1053 stop:2099 length:1047 start_codon:yes stop_codon:yes gene_type:complete
MMSKGTTFFKEVAKHNLERFHSECIAWGMHNFKKEFAILFIKEVTGISNINIDTIAVDAEVDRSDLKLTFIHEGITHEIFIENKIKASESSKNITRYFHKKLNKEGQKKVKVGDDVSQTEYYFLKERFRENIDNNKLHFCFLHSTNIIGEKRNNNWEALCAKNIKNPWVKISYFKLFELIKLDNLDDKNIDSKIFREYVTYCREENLLMGAEPISLKSPCKVILFPIHNAVKKGRDIYESTRKSWKISDVLAEIKPIYAVGLVHSISLGVFEIDSWEEIEGTKKSRFVKKSELPNICSELINKNWSKIISGRGYWLRGNPIVVEFNGKNEFKYIHGVSDKSKWLNLNN